MKFDFQEILGDLIIRKNIDAGSYSGVFSDSRKVEENSIFVAIRGTVSDGHRYIDSAVAKGAKAVVAQHLPDGVSGVEVKDSTLACALLIRYFYGCPDKDLDLFGVTGTNGKTTSVFFIEHIFSYCGTPCGLLSTIEWHLGSCREKADCTTPDSAVLYHAFSRVRDAGLKACAFELSSHALHQNRAGGVGLRGVVLTNITRDHLDYHGTAENYFQAKKIAFTRLLDPDCGVAVINVDDRGGERMARELAGICRMVTFGTTPAADWILSDIESSIEKSTFTLKNYRKELKITTSLFGRHNIENLAGAILLALDCGLPEDKVIEAVANFVRIPGRLERYVDSDGVFYFVDYAHTPDALERVLGALRSNTSGRLISVFGAGGNRDRGKRPQMGFAAAKHADVLIVTSDNPRDEDPLEIINEIVAGIPEGKEYIVIPDRREAIRYAAGNSKNSDVVLISGKGHEDYQEISGVRYDFSDAVELGKVLEELNK